MPPLELISCAAVAREWNNAEIKLIDAIADKKNIDATIAEIKSFSPDIVLSITGFECYEEDVNAFREIKSQFNKAKFIFFGHYATHFAEDTLKHSKADLVIMGEPEIIFDKIIKAYSNNVDLKGIDGIAYFSDNDVILQGQSGRIKNPNELPVPAYDILPVGDKYYEPLIPKPYGMIQTVRGCPYQCNYCVKSYGGKLTQLSVERVITEIKIWKKLFGVNSIRFIDDTFTISRNRVIDLCKAIIDEKLNISWFCLSRTDNLDEEVLTWMKKSGCIRIYFGMESGSQRMLDIYKKNVNAKEAKEALLLCKKTGIETAAFFMSGHPEETEKDFEETLQFAKDAGLTYASFNPLTIYPGTELFNDFKKAINFSIYPYNNQWKDDSISIDFDRRKELFYKGFYLRPKYILESVPVILNNFKEIAVMGYGLLRYILWDKRFVISGLKGARDM